MPPYTITHSCTYTDQRADIHLEHLAMKNNTIEVNKKQ